MKQACGTVLALVAPLLLLVACGGGSDAPGNEPDPPETACHVRLFDGDNYTDDSIVVHGPADYPTLEALPGSDKNWDDEADSFRSSSDAIVTFWTEQNFRGDRTEYPAGAQAPSVAEPRSMTIACQTQ